MNLSDLRKEYTRAELDLATVAGSPFDQFQQWFEEALACELNEPNAMVLATSTPEGRTSQRTVLLKSYDTQGFVFFTNYHSNKARQMDQNPHVSILFPWYGLERQVAIEGKAIRVSTGESMKYFLSRPHGSQLGAWVSHQSQVISSRGILEQKLAEMKQKFREGKVPFPDFWGGFRIIPTRIEFWQGRPNRLHDRILYRRNDESQAWQTERLAP